MTEQTGAEESRAASRTENQSENQSENRADNREANSELQQAIENRDQRRGGRNRHRGHSRGGGGGGQQQQQTAKSSLNMNELREIAALFSENGLTDFEFENENIRVRLRKELAPQIIQAAPQSFPPQQTFSSLQQPSPALQPQTSDSATAAASTDEDANLTKIESPIVGTFYRSPSPDADPFVKVGSTVTPETIVCIVEAMKLMNEIPAEVAGEIVKIYVENGQPVEYGQPLFAVK